jgi:phosphatidylinositol alpha 1,6-mannosyltransferase
VRILVVSESFLPQVNGVTNSVRRLLEHVADGPHDAVLLAPSGPEEYAGTPVRRVASVSMPTYRDFPVGLASRGTLRRVVDDVRPDVVHLASPALLGRSAGAVARERGIPVVAVYQTDLVGFAERYPFPGAVGLMRRLTASVHQPADLTLAPSTASLEQLGGLGVDRCALWPRGVDTDQFDPARRSAELRSEIGAAHDDLVVGYVGRLAAEKELDLLTVLHDRPGVRLVLVGGGPEEGRLRTLLPRARFLGVRHGDDLGRIVASLDVFVHTGRTETFCQSAQEALAAGVPVVAPDAGGPRDLVVDGVNGLRYAPGDAAALRRCVDALASDPWARMRMGRAARAGVRGRSWYAVNEALLDHYHRLVGATELRRAG